MLTKLSFWNAGKQTIDGNDVTLSDKVRIEIPGDAKVYSSHLSLIPKPVNC